MAEIFQVKKIDSDKEFAIKIYPKNLLVLGK